MTTLEDFFVEGEDVYIEDDVRLIGNTRIIGGSLTVNGNITLDCDKETHCSLKIKDGDLAAWTISSKHCDNISVEGSIYVNYSIYMDGCNIKAYHIYTTCLHAKSVHVLFDILFTTGNVIELYCERDCYIETVCNFNNGTLQVDGKFRGCASNVNTMLIGCGTF